MSKMYKICLIIAIFIISSSVAWAGFNYDATKNYFLLDSIFKSGGDYILVGDSLSGYCENSNYISQGQCQANGSIWHEVLNKIDSAGNQTESTSFFAISNNLIFPATGTFSSGIRQMSRDYFSTNAITVLSGQDFSIRSIGGSQILVMQANNLEMNQDLVIDNGLNFINEDMLSDYDIQVNTTRTNQVSVLGDDYLLAFGSGSLIAKSNQQISATRIYFSNNEDLCRKVSLKQGTGKYGLDGKWVGDQVGNLTTCGENYYVYDIYASANYWNSMICCRKP